MQPGWNDYRCFIGGRFVTGIRGFEYGGDRANEYIYAEGSDPQEIGLGNKTPVCSIKMLLSELQAIIDSSVDPTECPAFTVVHQFERKGTTAIITDVITGVRIEGWRKALDQGATFGEVTLPCKCLKISSNITTAVLAAKFNINLQ